MNTGNDEREFFWFCVLLAVLASLITAFFWGWPALLLLLIGGALVLLAEHVRDEPL